MSKIIYIDKKKSKKIKTLAKIVQNLDLSQIFKGSGKSQFRKSSIFFLNFQNMLFKSKETQSDSQFWNKSQF